MIFSLSFNIKNYTNGKKIQFDIEAREGLKKGVDALANAVKVTWDQKEEM